mgnify:CR=1 FL=1
MLLGHASIPLRAVLARRLPHVRPVSRRSVEFELALFPPVGVGAVPPRQPLSSLLTNPPLAANADAFTVVVTLRLDWRYTVPAPAVAMACDPCQLVEAAV